MSVDGIHRSDTSPIILPPPSLSVSLRPYSRTIIIITSKQRQNVNIYYVVRVRHVSNCNYNGTIYISRYTVVQYTYTLHRDFVRPVLEYSCVAWVGF